MTDRDLVQLLQLVKNDESAKAVVSDLLRDMIVELLQSNSEIRSSVVAVIKEDLSFSLDCSSFVDYYSNGYSLVLSVDGEHVTSTSFDVSR